MDIFQSIRAKINQVLQDQCTEAGVVYDSDRSKFDADPAVIITPSGSESDYHDTGMKQGDIVFIIRAHKEIPQDGQSSADYVLDKIVDQLLTIFNNSSVLSPEAEWVKPVISTWGYQTRGSSEFRTAEIKIICRKFLST